MPFSAAVGKCGLHISIVAHFIDANGCRQTKLLAIRQLKGGHSGENIAASVLRVIKEYKIRDRVGFLVLDNASSNGILRSLYPDMSEEARKRRRLRCLAHVTNLIAKAFYMGPKAADIVDELLLGQHHADFGRIASTWKKQGALGRLQNLIRYIRLTPKRREGFKNCQVDAEGWKEFNKLEVYDYVVFLLGTVLILSSFYKVTRPAGTLTLFQSAELSIAAGESNNMRPNMISGNVKR